MQTFTPKNYTDIEVKIDGHLCTISFDRDSHRNAFSDLMIDEFVEALYLADQDPEIRVIILTGKGKAFSAGGDIKDMESKSGMFEGEPNELRMRYKFGIQRIPQMMERLSTPTMAMVNGAAIGAGLDIACMCDLRVASSNAKFGETFTKLSLVPGDGGCFYLQRLVGYGKAMEMSLTGNIYNADEALEMKLVNKVVGPEDLHRTTRELAEQIASNSPIAVSMTKRAIMHAYQNDIHSTLELLSSFQGITQRSSDHFEALKSFKNKEEPKFKNK